MTTTLTGCQAYGSHSLQIQLHQASNSQKLRARCSSWRGSWRARRRSRRRRAQWRQQRRAETEARGNRGAWRARGGGEGGGRVGGGSPVSNPVSQADQFAATRERARVHPASRRPQHAACAPSGPLRRHRRRKIPAARPYTFRKRSRWPGGACELGRMVGGD